MKQEVKPYTVGWCVQKKYLFPSPPQHKNLSRFERRKKKRENVFPRRRHTQRFAATWRFGGNAFSLCASVLSFERRRRRRREKWSPRRRRRRRRPGHHHQSLSSKSSPVKTWWWCRFEGDPFATRRGPRTAKQQQYPLSDLQKLRLSSIEKLNEPVLNGGGGGRGGILEKSNL